MNEVDAKLKQAIAALKAGHHAKGRELLRQVIIQRPDDIIALLWLGATAETEDEKRKHLEKVLRIDPDNPQAKKGLQSLKVSVKPTSNIPEEKPFPSELSKTTVEDQSIKSLTSSQPVLTSKSKVSSPGKGSKVSDSNKPASRPRNSKNQNRSADSGKSSKKYWWIAGFLVPVVVPIILSLVGIIPNFLELIPNGGSSSGGGGEGAYTVTFTSGDISGNVAFNNLEIVIEEIQQELSVEELPDNVSNTLEQAMGFIQSKEYDKAIPLLESVITKVTPVPSLYNQLGAAYLATGNLEKGRENFEQALNIDPYDSTTRFNLSQLPPASIKTGQVVNFSSQFRGDFCHLHGCCSAFIVDGKPDVGWCSTDGNFPQSFVVELPGEFQISRFSFDHTSTGETDEDAKDVEVYISSEGPDFGYQKAGTFTLRKGEIAQGFPLDPELRGRWVKLSILSNHGNASTTRLMEFHIIGVPIVN